MNAKYIAQRLLAEKHKEELEDLTNLARIVIEESKKESKSSTPIANIQEQIEEAVLKAQEEQTEYTLEYLDSKLKQYIDERTVNKILKSIKEELFGSSYNKDSKDKSIDTDTEITIWSPKETVKDIMLAAKFEKEFEQI